MHDVGLGGYDVELGHILVKGVLRARVTYFNNTVDDFHVFHVPLSCCRTANAISRYVLKRHRAGTLDQIRLDA